MSFLDGNVLEKKERARKPNEGHHTILIESLEMLKTREHGEVPMVKSRVLETTTDRVGSEVGEAWFVNDGSEMQRSYTRGDALAFGRAMAASLGQDPGDTDAVKAMMKSLYTDPGLQASQPLRGLRLKWSTVTRITKSGEVATSRKSGTPLLNSVYAAMPQTAEDIKAGRAQVEVWRTGTVAPAPVAVAAPVPVPVAVPVASVPAGGFLANLGIK